MGAHSGKSGRSDSISSMAPFQESPSIYRSKGEAKDGTAATTAPRDGQSYYNHETKPIPVRTQPNERDRRQRAPRRQGNNNIGEVDTTPSQLPQLNAPQLTDMEVLHHLYQLLDQVTGPDNIDLVDPFERSSLLPPVTNDSLAELDIARIINNPKLRHDVNFDRELHFRPNLDGSRGRHKLKTSDEYWKALIGELELYRAVGARLITCESAHDQEYWTRMMHASQKRMPGMFETIREILKTLVPERDQARVGERLDVAMIMQEISKGVFDLMDLAQWLAKLLKAHCAPMRDEWIDQMVAQTRRGVAEGCQKRIVLGLRQLLGILEAMKLDVANHQIRHLRGLLIEDAINFQQRYHAHRMSLGRFDVTRSRRWFEREQLHYQHPMGPGDKLRTFTTAVMRTLLAQPTSFPDTFQLDTERLRSLRSDFHSIIYLDICCDVFQMLASRQVNNDTRQRAEASLRASLVDIVGESRRYIDNVGNIAAEIVRLVLHLEGSSNIYDASMLDFAERKLKDDLQQSSMAFSSRVRFLMEDQLPQLHAATVAGLKLSMMALHETMIPPLPLAAPFGLPKEVKTGREQLGLDDIVRRLAHVAILHWHIWSDTVYLTVEETAQDGLQAPLHLSPDDDHILVPGRDGIPTPSPSPNPGEGPSYSNHPSGPSLCSEPPEE